MGDSQVVTRTVTTPRGYLHCYLPWGDMDYGGPMKENAPIEQEEIWKETGQLSLQCSHSPCMERSEWMEMTLRWSLLLPGTWET